VTTSDVTRGTLPTDDQLENALRQLLMFEPRSGLIERLDARVAAAIDAREMTAARGRTRTGRGLRRRTIGLLAAAAFVAVGAGGAAGLYDGLGAAFEYGFDLQLARSVEIGASQEIDGYRVTIDRAYLDGERLMLAIRTVDERKRAGVGQVNGMYAIVSDASGTWQSAGSATGQPHGPWTGTSVIWRLAPEGLLPGEQDLHVVVPHIEWYDARAIPPAIEDPEWSPWRRQEGPWVFDIEVPVNGGTAAAVARPATTIDIDGVPVTLTEVAIGSSAIRVDLETPPDAGTWSFIGRIRFGDRVFEGALGSVDPEATWRLQFDGGVDDPTGDWTLEITEAIREGAAGETRIGGPWEFPFTVP
jgi:hypothetical protein